MELKEYITIILEQKKIFALVMAGILIASILFTATQQTSYATSMTLGITTTNRQQTPDYQYDGYYAIQASELFSDTVESWAESPDVVVDIFDKAGLTLPTDNLKKLAKIFTANKLSAQNVELRFKSSSEEEAKKLVSGVTQAIETKTKTINDASKGTTSFQIVFSDAITKENKQSMPLNAFIGLVVGFIIALGTAFSMHYISTDQKKKK